MKKGKKKGRRTTKLICVRPEGIFIPSARSKTEFRKSEFRSQQAKVETDMDYSPLGGESGKRRRSLSFHGEGSETEGQKTENRKQKTEGQKTEKATAGTYHTNSDLCDLLANTIKS